VIIYPFFMGVGVMIDFLVNIGQVETISAAYPWAVAILAAMLAVIVLIWSVKKNTA
jgi:hypothetical protein